ncbi:hypothetical protein C8R44DRAFT_847307 [Mycena epipterygia]|nr:hypothetical protein C8R44DRAFT_847307 [Mycena epipterygia]
MVPQELVDAIAAEVGNRHDLYACSLASSSFRSASQRLLFRTPQLPASRIEDWESRLTQSPHIAAYIKTLVIALGYFPLNTAANETFRKILGKLTNVDRCTLDSFSWKTHATSTPHILDFIRRQTFTAIRVMDVELPPAVVTLLVCSAPALAFWAVEVSPNLDFDDFPTSGTPKLKQLMVAASNGISDVLTRPDHSCYTANLRRLSVNGGDTTNRLVSAAARSLEHIRFQMLESSEPLQPLPPLAVLRFIDVWIEPGCDETLLIDSLSVLLISSPSTLEELTVTSRNTRSFENPYFRLDSLATLNRALAACPISPRIRWRFHFNMLNLDTSRFTDLAKFMELGMPRMHEEGRLIVEHLENSSLEDEKRSWSLRLSL